MKWGEEAYTLRAAFQTMQYHHDSERDYGWYLHAEDYDIDGWVQVYYRDDCSLLIAFESVYHREIHDLPKWFHML